MAANISAIVLKYSYVTCAPGSRSDSLVWTHDTSNSTFVNLKGKDTNIRNGLLEMAIVRGTTTLESIDMAAYIDTSARLRNERQAPAAYATFKDTALQVSFSVEGNQMRRIQLRFDNQRQCQEVIRILSERGLEIRESRQSRAEGRPGTATSDLRLNTAQTTHTTSSYVVPEKITCSGTIRVPDLEAGSLSQRSAMPLQTTSMTPASHHSSGDYGVSGSGFVPGNSAPRDVPILRPSSSRIRRHPSLHTQPVLLNMNNYATKAHDKGQPSSAPHITSLESTWQSHTEDTSIDSNNDMRPPSSALNARPSTYLESGTRVPPEMHHTDQRSLSAKSSSSVPLPAPATLQQESSSSSSRPSSSRALMMAPLPKPRIVQHRTAAQLQESTASVPDVLSTTLPTDAATSTRIEPVASATDLFNYSTQPSHGLLSHQRDGIRSRPGTSLQDGTESHDLIQNALPMDELLGRTKSSRKFSHANAPGTRGFAGAPPNTEPLPVTSSAAGTARLSGRIDSQRERAAEQAYTAVAASLRFPEDQALEQYSAKSPEDRLSIMDQFFSDNLENPSFTTLCEDVERCWRRIQLGL